MGKRGATFCKTSNYCFYKKGVRCNFVVSEPQNLFRKSVKKSKELFIVPFLPISFQDFHELPVEILL